MFDCWEAVRVQSEYKGTHNADSIIESKVIYITSNNVDLESK